MRMAHAGPMRHGLCNIVERQVREEKRRGERKDGKEPEELGDRMDQYLYLSKATGSVRQNTREVKSADAH